MLSTLAGRNYIVTGAASGIGLATVQKLLGLSANVHAIDRATDIPGVSGPGKLYLYSKVDVSSRSDVDQTFKKVFSVNPTIHGLVNAAGISPAGQYDVQGDGWAIEKDETYKRVMEINVGGTWNPTNELLRYTLARPTSERNAVSIVNIGSLASLRGYRTMTAYTASKHAVLGMTRSWAVEYGSQDIRVNIVAPGLIATALGLSALNKPGERSKVAQAYVAATPAKRLGTPEEVASPIVYLLSDEASYITGEVISVSGGN
ncbi:hypothetical protein FB567DRAFT_593134 [Paraphoma chrysanthemicola]|uniref:Uncharacterized protein n=1 Tax=Paraphoma chrysanthemicola TaxID=798071 RepID=A0A8K0VX20_9PLEO|nr:hypothetical protein FB567DRAFT_593134 [Paraphoma chrysanthemicola]